MLADRRVVARRQPNDQVMHADGFGRGNDRLRCRRSGSKRAIFCGHRAGQQLDVLRQIADVTAKRIRRPLIERGAVEAHVAAHRLPDADEQPRQRRFAGAAGADDAEPLPGLELEGDILDDNLWHAGRRRR